MTEIKVATQSFRVPCRNFSIRVSVAKSERLPLVKEFALRLLYVTGRCEQTNVQEFFGFSRREMAVLVRDLTDAGLVSIDGKTIGLSDEALMLFEDSVEGPPHLQTVETWNERFAIDFISFRLIRFNKGSEEARSVHELEGSDHEKVSRSREIARQVFADSFYEFLDKEKAETIASDERATMSIYGITSIEAKQQFTFPLQVDFYVDPMAVGEVRHSYPEFATDADQLRRERLVSEVARKLEDIKRRSYSGRSPRRLFEEKLGEASINRWVSDGEVDIQRLVEEVGTRGYYGREDERTLWVVGALMDEGNIDNIIDLSREALNDRAEWDVAPHETLFWQKPANEFWARDERSLRALSRLRREASGGVDRSARLNLVFDSSYENSGELHRRFQRSSGRRVFEEGLGMRFHENNKAIEAFFWPGVCAGIVYYYLRHSDDDISIPFGIITSDPARTRNIGDLLHFQWTSYRREVRKYWPAEQKIEGDVVEPSSVFGDVTSRSVLSLRK